MGFRTEEKSAHYATFKQQININVSEDTKAKFAKICKELGVPMTTVMVHLILEFIDTPIENQEEINMQQLQERGWEDGTK